MTFLIKSASAKLLMLFLERPSLLFNITVEYSFCEYPLLGKDYTAEQ